MNSAATQIASPLPLYTRESFTSISRPGDLQAFGYTFPIPPGRITDSRHDDRRRSSLSTEQLPPSYSESSRDVLPEYAPTYEPVTLAMYLFRFGFIFPLFWLMGALILITPLRAPSAPPAFSDVELGSWLPEKTESERQAFMAHIRKAELKWAKRCLFAFIVFGILLGGIVAFSLRYTA